jgi:copper chaperone CopZ
MFSFFNKKPQGTTEQFSITGMHCPSCAMSIDGALEDLPGVFNATTQYAQGKTTVEYDPAQLSSAELKAEIIKAGYTVI